MRTLDATATAANRTGPVLIEEALPLLQAKIAEKNGEDSFKLKVFRKASMGAPPMLVATLADATLDHVASTETWLPALAGSGPIYVIAVTHTQDQLPVVTFQPPALPGQPRDVDPKIVGGPDWRGPPVLTYPAASDKPAVPSAAGGAASLFHLFSPGGGTADPSARPQGTPTVAGAGLSSERLELLDARHRMEMEALAKAIESRATATERQIATLADSIKALAAAAAHRPDPIPPKPLSAQIAELAPILTAVAGIVTPLIVKSRESEAEERRRAAEREDRREAAAEAARQEQVKMLAQMNERASNASADTMKVITPMVDAVSQMGRTVLQQVATMQELTQPAPQEESLFGLVKAGMQAFADVMVAKQEAAQSQGQRRLPPKPANEKTDESEKEESGPTLDDLRAADPAELLGQIETAIRAHHDPRELADGFLDALSANPGVEKAVREAGGAMPFFRARLGDAWIQAPEHLPYVQSLIATLTNSARMREKEEKTP